LKYHGGKSYLAKRLVEMMPPHVHYVETHAGGLSVLLEKDPEGVSEVVNDLDRHVANFWQVMQHDHLFEQFARIMGSTPFSSDEWKTSKSLADTLGWAGVDDNASNNTGKVLRACCFFVTCRQSMAGRSQSFAPLSRTRTRRGMNEQASAWMSCVDGLPEVHERLRRVVVLNDDAVRVIEQQDGPETLFYVDPPYVPSTRSSTGQYRHEMNVQQHHDLLVALGSVEGKFLLSGYRSELYDDYASGWNWNRTDFDLPNNAASGGEKRRMIECVWRNY
jgi:DNA adenine methylase